MKTKHYTRSGILAVVMALSLAFAPLPEDVLKLRIVKHEDGNITIHDTLVEVGSDFTIEKYLTSKGLNPRDAEIIYTNFKPNQNETNKLIGEINYESSPSYAFLESHMGMSETATITKRIDRDGKVYFEKKTNGETMGFNGDEVEDFKALIEQSSDISAKSDNNVTIYEFKAINDDGDSEEAVMVKQFLYSNDSSEGNTEDGAGIQYNFVSSEGDTQALLLSPQKGTENKTMAFVTLIERHDDERSAETSDREISRLNEPLKLSIEDLSFFPNPSNGQLRLEFFLPHRGQTEIALYDLSGKEVHSASLGDFQGMYTEKLNFTNLEPGTYIMRILQNNLSLAKKLIIK